MASNTGGTAGLFDESELPLALKPPAYFVRLPARLDVEFCCPRCSYGWSGNPKPTGEDASAALGSEGAPE